MTTGKQGHLDQAAASPLEPIKAPADVADERFSVAVECAPHGVLMVDQDGRILLVNRQFESMFGYARAELIGERIEMLLPMHSRSRHVDHRQRYLMQAETRMMGAGRELYGVRKDGSEFPVEIGLNPVATGGSLMIVATVIDITERKAANGMRARLAAIVECSDDAIISKTLDGFIDSWNAGAERMFGYAAEEMIGRSGSLLIPPESQHEEQRILARLREGEGVRHYETARIHKEGNLVEVSLTISPIRNAQGQIVGAAEVARDIRAQKRAQASMIRSQKMESLGTLAGGVAHDFNNLLLAISGNARMAAQDLGQSHPVLESLAEISRAAERGAELVRRILAFSRQEEPKRKTVALQLLIQDALKLLRASLPAWIDLKSEFAPDVPPVAADATQIHQVVMNLVTNAAHAIGTRSGVVEVFLHTVVVTEDMLAMTPDLHTGRFVRLTVSDNGCGMDRATLERVFDPFFTTKPVGEGTGLGLSTVHGIVKAHGGAVNVYSALGKGTRFHVYLPTTEDTVAIAPATQPIASATRVERVLYVDDEAALTRLATRVLSRLGYHVTAFNDPVRALETFRAEPTAFDVAIIDLSMPGMSGFELAQRLLERRPDLRIVMTTGYVRPEDEEHASQVGIRKVMLKPTSFDELGRVLGELLDTPDT
jgi:PAS domain S-box-containing protein